MTRADPLLAPVEVPSPPEEHSMPRRVLNLDGEWRFAPGDGPPPDTLSGLESIRVPGLWEAQGRLRLDGCAWYVREVDLDQVAGCWTLEFGGVMDEADVYVNGVLVGRHAGAFTPFRLDVSGRLRRGANVVAVRVLDVPADDPRHLHSAHGKQGWKNDVFPSPPSLYMTYGGIWQSVTLVRHGSVTIEVVFVNGDPGKPEARVRVRNRSAPVALVVECEVAGKVTRERLVLSEGSEQEVTLRPHLADLTVWSPEAPALHLARVRLLVDDEVCDARFVRFGVRTVAVHGDRLLLNGRPLRVRAALVQGFRGDTLYAEGTRTQIEEEVRAAKALGLNMLRLHIKAFDPVYLDVCDELGMLLHCDFPIAEPLAVAELDDTGPLAQACAAVAAEQVTRDRNHPCVILWTLMNEIGAENVDVDVRAGAGYQRFVHLLYEVVTRLDGTRPIIENDYIEPSPEHVHHSRVLTTHWYGRLSRGYLADVLAKCARSTDPDRLLLVSEFGDWALPSLRGSSSEPEPFWSPTMLRDGIAALPWPGTVEDFVRGTQVYKGIADRLQIELFRRVAGVGGWCLTQLTDVPHEYNGLWELDRSPKPAALDQLAAACRPTLPTLSQTRSSGRESDPDDLGAWNGWAGEEVSLSVVVSHDQPDTATGHIDVSIAKDSTGATTAARPDSLAVTLAPHAPTSPATVRLQLPRTTGRHIVRIKWTPAGQPVVLNSYDLHVYPRPRSAHAVSVLGSAGDAAALEAAGAVFSDAGPLVVGEGGLTASLRPRMDDALRSGRNVLVLAQTVAAAQHLPVPAAMADLATEWGSLPYVFSTADHVLSAVAPGTVVTTELLSVTPSVVYTSIAGGPWPERLTLGLYKPEPSGLTGVVVGALPVHRGLLWLCQLPLVDAALLDDPTAVVTLADLIGVLAASAQGPTP